MQPKWAPALLHGHWCGQWGAGEKIFVGKKYICAAVTLLEPTFLLATRIFKNSKSWISSLLFATTTLLITFKWTSLLLPTPCLHFLGCGGLFCGVHSLLLGHHLLKKYKWWGMPACKFLLAWPQTSDEQAGNVFGMPWLPLLGPQCPFTPKGVTDSPGL